MGPSRLALHEPEPVSEPKVRAVSARLAWLIDGDCRLDASFYADDVVAARRAIEDSGFDITRLSNAGVTKQVFWPARFKRVYTDDPQQGYPFLQASRALMFRPLSERWLARCKAPDPKEYFAQEGWILVTRSGVVGRCVLVGRCLARFFLSEDLIRVVPVVPAGYLYAFLSSWMGQALMVKQEYGMTVSHLEPHHLARLPVPILPPSDQDKIHDEIVIAYSLRDEANELLDEADALLHAELGLSRFNESQVPYLSADKPKAFVIEASQFDERFDASFHLPLAKTYVAQMEKGKYPLVKLGAIAEPYLAPRFRRIYVARQYGVPFLQGSHIPLMKPYDLKYLSPRAHADLSPWLIRKGWVLVTCSGVVGRVALAASALDGWAASQHIERIIPRAGRADAGYLAAFLMTPYGQHQLTSKIYGGVVDELTEEDTASVFVPDAPMPVQERIGALVTEAFEKKEEANKVEEAAVRQLETLVAPAQTRPSAVSYE
jgi:type I restriction enzyme S subunit